MEKCHILFILIDDTPDQAYMLLCASIKTAKVLFVCLEYLNKGHLK